MLYNKITNKYKAPKKVVNAHKFYKHLQFKNLIYLFIKAPIDLIYQNVNFYKYPKK